MTTPSEEEEEEEEGKAMEKELSHILDEVEAVINDPSESVERKKEAQVMIKRAIEKGSSNSKTKSGEKLVNVMCTLRGCTTHDRYKN